MFPPSLPPRRKWVGTNCIVVVVVGRQLARREGGKRKRASAGYREQRPSVSFYREEEGRGPAAAWGGIRPGEKQFLLIFLTSDVAGSFRSRKSTIDRFPLLDPWSVPGLLHAQGGITVGRGGHILTHRVSVSPSFIPPFHFLFQSAHKHKLSRQVIVVRTLPAALLLRAACWGIRGPAYACVIPERARGDVNWAFL